DGIRDRTVTGVQTCALPILRGLDARVLFEPGRLLVANASVLLTRVLLRKQGAGGRRFAVADAGMNDLLRPALYGAHHEVEPVGRSEERRVGKEGRDGAWAGQ